MHLLVVTGLWPTDDSPTAGVFVRDRLRGTDAVVIAAARYRKPALTRYSGILVRAIAAHGPFSGVEAHVLFPAGMIGLLTARLRRIPLVVVVHGSDIELTAQRNPLLRWLSRLVAVSATQVIANSAATQARLQALGAPSEVIHPGVDLRAFHPTPRENRGKVLYLGGAAPHKGVAIARQYADTLAGPGIRLIQPAQVPEMMAQHDIVLVPSHREGFGLVAAQAIAAGRWVVASDVGGLREIVTDRVNGTLVSDGDYGTAIANVPDYDPVQVASTASRFDLAVTQAAFAELWQRLTPQ